MKKTVKLLVTALCCLMLTSMLAMNVNASTCTSFSCRLRSYFSSYSGIITQQSATKAGNSQAKTSNITQSDNSSSKTTYGSAEKASSEASDVQTMLALVNNARTSNGLSALKLNSALSSVAQAKAEDMAKNNYFSHTSPTYGSPFEMMKSFGIKYRYAAENIAKNASVEKAHYALMNSDGHRKNILNGNYTEIGIGIVKTSQNSYIIVQMFVG